MAKRDYYEVLGVTRNGSEEEIRKSFRRKAMEYHPDKNKSAGAEAQFKEINEAYQVLSDPEMRQRYDHYGHAGMSGNGGRTAQDFQGYDVFGGFGDIFDAFFGDFTGRTQRRGAQRGSDIRYTATILFEEAAFGTQQEVEVARTERCHSCQGNGAEPGSKPVTCSTCRGSGQVRRNQRTIFGQFQQIAVCSTCRGKGTVITTPCTNCRGGGTERRKRKIMVDIPGGIDGGMQVRLSGEGDVGINGGPAGNLYISVMVKPHSFLRREENDLIYELPISFVQAALGDKIDIPTLQNTELLTIPAGTQPGAVFRFKGKGVSYVNDGHRRGDLLVAVKLEVPISLTDQQKKLLEELASTMGDGENDSTRERGLFNRIKDTFGTTS